MSARTPDGSALGFSDISLPEPDDDPLSDEWTGESVIPAELPEPPPPMEVEEGAEEGAEPPEPTEAPEPPPPPEKLYAGRYLSEEALEKAYLELQAEYTRSRQQAVEVQKRQEQMEEVLGNLVPILEQQLAQADPEAAERFRAQQEMQTQAKTIAEQEMAPLREQLEFQRQQAEVDSLVAQFRSRHPDVTPGSAADYKLVQTAQELGVNAADINMLELSYEAMGDAYLRQVLKANPVLVESDEGIAYARVQARLLEGLVGAARPAPQQQPSPQARTAYVETGEGGTPARAASSTEFDEFDEAMDAWAKGRRSPLFGGS